MTTPKLPVDKPLAALERLVTIALGDTGQSGRVASFLLAWWDAKVYGGFDLTDLWGLDGAIVDDIVLVMSLIANESGRYPNDHGLQAEFERIIARWGKR